MGDGYRMDKFFRFNESLQRFFDLSASIDTTFQQFTQTFAGTGTQKPLNAAAWKRLDGIIGETAECSTVGFIFGGL